MLHGRVTHGYSDSALAAEPAPCVAIAVRKPVGTPSDPAGRVASIAQGTTAWLKLSGKGLELDYRLPAEDYRAARVVDGVGMARDDTIALVIYEAVATAKTAARIVKVRAVTNARNKCVTMTKTASAESQNQLCKSQAPKGSRGEFTGTLTMTYDQLRQAGVGESFDVGVRLRIWNARDAKGDRRVVTYEGGDAGAASAPCTSRSMTRPTSRRSATSWSRPISATTRRASRAAPAPTSGARSAATPC